MWSRRWRLEFALQIEDSRNNCEVTHLQLEACFLGEFGRIVVSASFKVT